MEKIVESDPQVVKNWLQNIFVGITIPQTGFMSNWLNIFPTPIHLSAKLRGVFQSAQHVTVSSYKAREARKAQQEMMRVDSEPWGRF